MTPEQVTHLLQTGGLVAMIGAVLVFLVALGIMVLILLFLSSCLERVPMEFRKQQPAMVWLLLIPCFNVVWNFFVYPKIAASYQAYFSAKGRTDVGDCGMALANFICIGGAVCFVLGVIPYLGLINCLLAPALLVVWIMFLVKASALKAQIVD